MRLQFLVAAVALGMVLPSGALASHMGQYVSYPVSHDALGSVLEPDFQTTSVLGPTVTNCVVELPSPGAFDSRCGDDAAKTGLGDVLAPGCTGADANGAPVRRVNGQCALWTIGVWGQGNHVVPGGTIPPPISEPGMGPGIFPGRYAGTVRFLDGVVDHEVTQNPGTGGPSNTIALNRYLREAGVGNWVLPGQSLLWAWNGAWTDLNGNGVVDACHATCSASMENEFVWYGNCQRFLGEFSYYSVAQGFCKEDPNPNVPGSHACVEPEAGPCANAQMVNWVFPGNHNAGMLSDMPGNQVLTWMNNFNCNGPPTCDEVDRDAFGDPLLGRQGEVTPDGLGMDDRTGDNGAADVGDDSARHWVGNLGNVGTYYGDDGFLVTAVYVYGYNCAAAPKLAQKYELNRPAGTEGACTFLDVDKYPTVSPLIEEALVGDPEQPNEGLKGVARHAWFLFHSAPCDCPVVIDTLNRRVDAIIASRDVYEATLGPQQGYIDDMAIDAGWSREPNSPPRTYIDAAGSSHDVSESYLGVTYGSCEDAPVGDARNPTSALDLISLEDQHRGFCNVGPQGLGTAYRLYEQQRRGWIDAQPLRHVLVGTPVTVTPPCTYCFFGTPFVGIGMGPEPASVPNPVEDHTRTLGAGNYLFRATVGTWRDEPHTHDESVFPDPPNSKFVTYPVDHWVGVIAKSGGQWHYRNFLPITCTTEKDGPFESSEHEAAECNPYLDGNGGDPQDYTSVNQGGEFDGKDALACAGSPFSLAPADGVLDTQIIVVREYAKGIGPLLPSSQLPHTEMYGPGPVDPLGLGIVCGGGGFLATDLVVWPAGNLGDDIVTWIRHEIPLDADVDGDGALDTDTLTDVDFYGAIRVVPEV